jgi:oxygen-dependent protoporphyrinogen oxidase
MIRPEGKRPSLGPLGETTQIAVVGGGISGLAAAHRLVEQGAPNRWACEVRLVEAGDRLGGLIHTRRHEGFIEEFGPDAFVTTKPWALDLIRRLGLSERLIGTNPANRRTFVARGWRLHPLPDGFFLFAPRQIGPFLRSGLLTWRGKARTALEVALPRGRPGEDESLASFVRRRFGAEALARLAQPMVGGIYTADPERLSLRATIPQFLEMEARHRSVILALGRQGGRDQSGGRGEGGARYSLFASLDDGLETLVDALTARLPRGAVRLNSPVMRVTEVARRWRLDMVDGTALEADGVIITLPAFRAAGLVRDLDPDLARELDAIPYASSVVVNLAYRRELVSHPLDGFGFVVPACEGRHIIACSFSSVKFPGRAPAGHVLMRVFAGGALQPELSQWDDRAVLDAALRDLEQLLGTRGAPLWSHVTRHDRAMPQYHVGHLSRVAEVERRLARWPGLALAGNAYRGIGIPDAIRSGEAAADGLFGALRSGRPAWRVQAVS